jgi:hypothetical protein
MTEMTNPFENYRAPSVYEVLGEERFHQLLHEKKIEIAGEIYAYLMDEDLDNVFAGRTPVFIRFDLEAIADHGAEPESFYAFSLLRSAAKFALTILAEEQGYEDRLEHLVIEQVDDEETGATGLTFSFSDQ